MSCVLPSQLDKINIQEWCPRQQNLSSHRSDWLVDLMDLAISRPDSESSVYKRLPGMAVSHFLIGSDQRLTGNRNNFATHVVEPEAGDGEQD